MELIRYLTPAGKLASLCMRLMFALVLVAPTLTTAQSNSQYPDLDPLSYPVTSNLDQVQFYLLTVNLGNQVWDNFGHTALRMVDETSGTDTVFNWGLFDASGGVLNFSYDFFKGVMNYQLGSASPEFELRQYRQQRRTVWQDRINLTDEQKEVLYRRLMWNVRAENRVYSYQYFYDNCTTRVRDYLDEALMGRLQAQTSGSADVTFRTYVFNHYRSVGLIGFGLDIMMNSEVDRDISVWEEMFLPLNLRQQLMSMPSDLVLGGQRQMILSDGVIMEQFETPQAQINGYWLAMALLLLPAAALVWLEKYPRRVRNQSANQLRFKLPAVGYRLLGLTGLMVSLFSGILGLVMLGSWMFSDHEILHRNLNLLLFWPTDLLGLVVAAKWLVKAMPWQVSASAAKLVNCYLFAHCLAALAYLLVFLFGWSAQAVANLLIFILPGYLLFLVLVMRSGFRQISVAA